MLRVVTHQWPLVITEVSGEPGADDVAQAIREYERLFAEGDRFVSLVDVTRATSIPSSSLRNTYADWRSANRKRLAKHVAAVAFVVGDHPLLLGTLTALAWMARHPSPTGHFRNHDDAMVFLAPYLRDLEQRTVAKSR